MITSSDSLSTIDLGAYYAILPCDGTLRKVYENNTLEIQDVAPGFAYNSGTNPQFLNVEQLRQLIRENVDSNFEPI